MPFCAHWRLILSRLLAPLPVFCPWSYVPTTEDPTEKLRAAGASSSPAQARAMADTAVLVCRVPAWGAPSAFSNTAPCATWPSSTEYFRHPPVQAETMSPAQNNRMALITLLHRRFLKAEDPKREHNKLLIKSSRWPLLWLLSFTIASNLFFCMCCISETEMLNSSLLFMPESGDNAALVALLPS